MSEREDRNTMSAGAWIAIGVGGIIALVLLLGCLGVLIFGVRATQLTPVTSSPAPVPTAAPATSPAPAPSTR